LTTQVSAVPEIETLKFKIGHTTLTIPLLRVICHTTLGLNIANLCKHLTTVAAAVPKIWLVPTEI